MGWSDPTSKIPTANESVCALIVTHHPDEKRLQIVIDAIRPQVGRLIIIDNKSDDSARTKLQELCREGQDILLENDRNIGLAAAYNQGIRWAAENEFTQILFLDQDSVPKPGMVDRLTRAIVDLESTNTRIAAVGPVIHDPRLGISSPFVNFSAIGVKRRACNPDRPDGEIAADFLISSGMLAKISVFDLVGSFDEGLFIDNVDMEWCFRALAKGYRCYGICGATLEHQLGEKVSRIWLGRWMTVYRHGPVRQYYIMRNRILLYKKKYSPRGWILQDILRVLFKVFMFAVFFGNRRDNLLMMVRGIRDGWRGKDGPCPY